MVFITFENLRWISNASSNTLSSPDSHLPTPQASSPELVTCSALSHVDLSLLDFLSQTTDFIVTIFLLACIGLNSAKYSKMAELYKLLPKAILPAPDLLSAL